jgi:hypothetical protein
VTSIGVADVGTEGGDFDRFAGCAHGTPVSWRALIERVDRNQHDSELLTDCVGFGEDLHDLARSSVGRYIVISRIVCEEEIADTSSGEVSLMTVFAQGADDFGGVLFGVGQEALNIQRSAFTHRTLKGNSNRLN